jgi:DDE superfamily endonuclease
MVWGCMTADGPGSATSINGIMDSRVYQDILEEHLLGTLEHYGKSRSDIVFQHDNDPKHVSKSTLDYLRYTGLNVLKWPPQSPDMNPIEHLWGLVKKNIVKDPYYPKNKTEMWIKFKRIWETVSKEECVGLIDSMPGRVRKLLRARGGYTKY